MNERQLQALVDAVGQVLDDMGVDGLCVCPLAKARARIAYEPFFHPGDDEHLMLLADAERIVRETMG